MNRDERFWQKGIDSRRLYLYLKKHLGMLLGVTVLCALLAAGIYYPVKTLQAGEPMYEGVSQYYITFRVDEFGDVYDYYNAYTWNHDVITCDAITDYALTLLPETVTREQIKESVKAELPGDERFMTVTVTTPDAALTGAIQDAYTKTLPRFAEMTKGLGDIVLTQQSPVQVAAVDYKTENAALLGAVLGFLGTLSVLLLRFGADDAFYVEGDVKKQFPYPFLGQITKNRNGLYLQELWTNLRYCGKDGRDFCLVGCDGAVTKETAQVLEELSAKKTSETDQSALRGRVKDEAGGPEQKTESHRYQFRAVGSGITESLTAQDYALLRQAQGVLIVLAFGRTDGRAAAHLAEQLSKQDCPVTGVILSGGEERFLERYYGRKGRRRL